MHQRVDQLIEQRQGQENSKYVYKKLGLNGCDGNYTKYFESITEEQFEQIKNKRQLRLTKLKATKYNGGACYLGGIETTLSNGDFFKCGESLHPEHHHTMDLSQFDVQTIKIQRYSKHGNFPCGWRLSGPNGEIDVASKVQKGHEGGFTQLHDIDYARLTPEQELIGVYGYQYSDGRPTRIGFIVKERVKVDEPSTLKVEEIKSVW